MLNSASLGLLQYIPLPNVPGLVDNYHLQTSVPTQQDRFNARLLQTISPKLNARLIYALSDSSNHAFQSFPDLESDVSTLGQSVTAGLTENLSRQWINDSQLIFSRSRVQTLDNFAYSQNVAGDLGITGVSAAPIDWQVPSLSFNNYTHLSPAAPSLVRNQTYRFVDAVTYMLPKHTVTFGAEVRRIENNTDTDQTPEGLFTFSGLETALVGANGQAVSGTGLDFADFLLGDPYSTNERFGTPSSYFRSWGTVGYVSDDWRARSDFTLQFGARYEFFTPPTELYGHLSNLDYDPAAQQVALVIPGEAGPFSGALPAGLIRPNYNHWSPRIGLAWRPPIKSLQANHSMVVRAGYGLFYNESIYTQLLSELANQPPWSNSQLRITSPSDLLTLQDGFPSTVAAQNTVQNTYAVNPNYKVGYAQIWNLSVETNIAPNTALVAYLHGNQRQRSRYAVRAKPSRARKPHAHRAHRQRRRLHLRHFGSQFDLQLAASPAAEAPDARNHDQRHLHVWKIDGRRQFDWRRHAHRGAGRQQFAGRVRPLLLRYSPARRASTISTNCRSGRATASRKKDGSAACLAIGASAGISARRRARPLRPK